MSMSFSNSPFKPLMDGCHADSDSMVQQTRRLLSAWYDIVTLSRTMRNRQDRSRPVLDISWKSRDRFGRRGVLCRIFYGTGIVRIDRNIEGDGVWRISKSDNSDECSGFLDIISRTIVEALKSIYPIKLVFQIPVHLRTTSSSARRLFSMHGPF
ncbi:hypothetical protein BDZ97DRAFT_1281429 [Flammula alnicola]|nr:hypothetical protein BDZ97DRAFT_1281429 [Flammula alnicola]